MLELVASIGHWLYNMAQERYLQPQAEDLPIDERISREVLEKLFDPGTLTDEEKGKLTQVKNKGINEALEGEFQFLYPRKQLREMAELALAAALEFIKENNINPRPSLTNFTGRIEGPSYFGMVFQKTLQDGSVVNEAAKAKINLERRLVYPTRVFYIPFSGTDEAKESPDLISDAIKFIGFKMDFGQLLSLSSNTPGVGFDITDEGKFLQIWNLNKPDFLLSLRVSNWDETFGFSDCEHFKFNEMTLYFLPSILVDKLKEHGKSATPSIFR